MVAGSGGAAQEAAATGLLAVFAGLESDEFDEDDDEDEDDESDELDEDDDEPEESEEPEELDDPFAEVTVLDDEDRLSVR